MNKHLYNYACESLEKVSNKSQCLIMVCKIQHIISYRGVDLKQIMHIKCRKILIARLSIFLCNNLHIIVISKK